MDDEADGLQTERERVVRFGLEMRDQGLTNGTMGNVSARRGNRFAVSPSGIDYDEITAQMVPVLTLDGQRVHGDLKPSSETPMHSILYDRRDDVGGVVHTHSPYASTFAALDEPILASHYLIGFAGRDVPLTDYAPPGTAELGRMAADTMGADRDAVLLKNHGVIAVGDTLEDALEVASVVEYCARIHYQASAIGDPDVLPDEDVDELREMFHNEYGQDS